MLTSLLFKYVNNRPGSSTCIIEQVKRNFFVTLVSCSSALFRCIFTSFQCTYWTDMAFLKPISVSVQNNRRTDVTNDVYAAAIVL